MHFPEGLEDSPFKRVLADQLTPFGPGGQILPAILLLAPRFLDDAASLKCIKQLFLSGIPEFP